MKNFFPISYYNTYQKDKKKMYYLLNQLVSTHINKMVHEVQLVNVFTRESTNSKRHCVDTFRQFSTDFGHAYVS